VADRETKRGAADLGWAVSGKMAELGVWAQLSTLPAFGGVFRIAPPITTTEEQLDQGLAIIEEALRTTPGTMPLYDDRNGNLPSRASPWYESAVLFESVRA
jgi:adenosylmethionine-8-amino-7-oxononanoate aminotransferase